MSRNAKAFEVERDDEDKNVGRPGAYYFVENGSGEKAGIIHGCPCGCGGRSVMFFEGKGEGHQEWKVSGDWPNVTLSPSVGIRFDAEGNSPPSGYHWHGFLRDGVFVEC